MKTLKKFLEKLVEVEGSVSISGGVATFEDGTTFNLSRSVTLHYGQMIERFAMCHSGVNPGGYTAEAVRTGDYQPTTGQSIYEEVRIGVFRGDDKFCVAEVLVGLTGHGEPRVLVSADANVDEPTFCIYPMRSADAALERWRDK